MLHSDLNGAETTPNVDRMSHIERIVSPATYNGFSASSNLATVYGGSTSDDGDGDGAGGGRQTRNELDGGDGVEFIEWKCCLLLFL